MTRTDRVLTGQVENQNGEKGDIHTGNDEIDHVEKWFPSNEQGEGHIEIRIVFATIVENNVSNGRLEEATSLAGFWEHRSIWPISRARRRSSFANQ